MSELATMERYGEADGKVSAQNWLRHRSEPATRNDLLNLVKGDGAIMYELPWCVVTRSDETKRELYDAAFMNDATAPEWNTLSEHEQDLAHATYAAAHDDAMLLEIVFAWSDQVRKEQKG